jgi:6-phosphogluconolactonase
MHFYGARDLTPDRPLFAVMLLGIGEDGHTASLFPGSPALQERSHWVMPVPDTRPESRITLTYPALESSRDVVFLVTGAAKRAVLQTILNGESDSPAARLRPVGRVHWFIDRAAAPARPS